MTAIAIDALRRHLGGLDPTLSLLALLFTALAVLAPEQAVASLRFTVGALVRMAPALALGLAVGAWVKAAGAEALVGRVFGGRVVLSIAGAALLGALSPFCSCGVVPVVAALLAAGVPLAPVMAFWLSSPLMDPQTFFIVAGAFDLPFAFAKLASAVAIGLLGGFAVLALGRRGVFTAPLRPELALDGEAARRRLQRSRPRWAICREPERRRVFLDDALRFGRKLAKIMTLAFTLESLMLAWLPADTVAGLLGGDSAWAVPLAVAVGVPAYLNSLVAIPLTAGLVAIGMSKGAALAFLTAGAISSIPAAMAVTALVRPPVFAAYLGLAVAGSLLVGWAYELWLGF
jgi:hypothetical protein